MAFYTVKQMKYLSNGGSNKRVWGMDEYCRNVSKPTRLIETRGGDYKCPMCGDVRIGYGNGEFDRRHKGSMKRRKPTGNRCRRVFKVLLKYSPALYVWQWWRGRRGQASD